MTPLRIAVLGAGMVGRRHIQTILSRPELAELVAVADPAADRAQFAGPITWFDDVESLLDWAKPEAVIIATPTALHAAQGRLCAARGIHFLAEKPVTATLEEADALVRAVSQSGVKTLVGHHRRYLAVVEEARRVIAAGEIGALVAASVVWATRKPDEYFKMGWRTRPGGGPLLINAIHEIDLLRHLCGDIRVVSGLTSHGARGFAVEDSAAALFQFDNGCLGTLTLTDAGLSPWTIEQGSGENPTFPQTGQSAYRVIGTRGSLEMPVLRLWQPRTPNEIGWDKPLASTNIRPDYHDPFEAQLRHFQRLIRLNETPRVSVLEGAKTLAATLAVAQSSSTGKPVAPPAFG
jgi:predicted dehydrogenase